MRKHALTLVAGALMAAAACSQTVVDTGTSGVPNDADVMGNGAIVAGGGPFGTDAYHSPPGTFNDRLQIARDGNLTDLDIPAGGAYTLTCFYQHNGGGAEQGVAMFGSCCSPREGYTITITPNGQLRFWGGASDDGSNYNCTAGPSVNDGQWHLLTIQSQAGGPSQTWVDTSIACGPPWNEGPDNVPTSPSLANPEAGGGHGAHNPQIGGRGISYQNTADVMISDVRIYSTFLSASEIADIATSGAGPDPDLLWLLGEAGMPPPPPAPVSGATSLALTIFALMGATLVFLGRRGA